MKQIIRRFILTTVFIFHINFLHEEGKCCDSPVIDNMENLANSTSSQKRKRDQSDGIPGGEKHSVSFLGNNIENFGHGNTDGNSPPYKKLKTDQDLLTTQEENHDQTKMACGIIEVKFFHQNSVSNNDLKTVSKKEGLIGIDHSAIDRSPQDIILTFGTAFLIAKDFALTAAHNLIIASKKINLKNHPAKTWQNWAGITFHWQWEGKYQKGERKVKRVYIHPDWNPFDSDATYSNQYDYCLIELEEAINGFVGVDVKKTRLCVKEEISLKWCGTKEDLGRLDSEKSFKNYIGSMGLWKGVIKEFKEYFISYSATIDETNNTPLPGYSGSPVEAKDSIIAIHTLYTASEGSSYGGGLRITGSILKILKEFFPN